MVSISSCEILIEHYSQMQTTKTKQQHLPRPSLLLKDYLMRDDLSSCSSNGFKSFPRRQCCSTVGLILVEKDRKLQQRRKRRRNNKTLLLHPQPLPRSTSSSSCSSSKVSVLQRASEAIINAIKSMPPLSSPKNGSAKKTAASGVLSRSFSRRLFSRSFWRKAGKEDHQGSGEGTQRWRTSFRELLMLERNKTASLNEDNVFTAVSSCSSSSASSSGCGSNNSWGESEFTFSSSAAAASERSSENDVADGAKEVALHHKIEEVTSDWQNVEKEQFSPVSVLDCPFEDDEGSTPHFNSTTHSLLEGAEQKKHIQKRRHFESVASVEPVALEKRMAWPEPEEEEPHNNSTKHAVTVPSMCTQNGNTNVFHYNIEDNARDLLDFVKRSIPSNCLVTKAESLLFDYFKQSTGENVIDIDHNHQSKKLHLCKVAEDWVQGQPEQVYLGWEVQEGRQIYIKEMDKCVEWRNTDQEVQQLALALENEVFTSLINELIVDYLTIC